MKTLPDNAELGQLRTQAKELRRAASGGNPAALGRIGEVLPNGGADLPLRDAQFVIAREYGFESWRDLAAAVVAQQTGGRDVHRWFGVELNNSTWELLDNGLGQDSPRAEQENALFAAYASAYHWRQTGTVANHGRGEHLVASVACALGLLDAAGRHANRYQELIDAHPAAFADWDRGFAAEALARVAALRGDPDAAERLAVAREAAQTIADPEDRDIVIARLAQDPW